MVVFDYKGPFCSLSISGELFALHNNQDVCSNKKRSISYADSCAACSQRLDQANPRQPSIIPNAFGSVHHRTMVLTVTTIMAAGYHDFNLSSNFRSCWFLFYILIKNEHFFLLADE